MKVISSTITVNIEVYCCLLRQSNTFWDLRNLAYYLKTFEATGHY